LWKKNSAFDAPGRQKFPSGGLLKPGPGRLYDARPPYRWYGNNGYSNGMDQFMTSNRRILVVDDDENLLEMLAEQLQIREEFLTETISNGTDAIERTKDQYFDIILLDVGLPDIDGREVCRIMRRNGVNSPVIMLTGADTDADTILGLDAGANDYVTKPFRIGVLMARLRAHIREHEQSEFAVFTIGPYTFRPAAKQLLDNETNKKVRLTDKETSIIKYLFLVGERVVSRDVLLDEVWGYNAGVTTHTLETHVYRLRQKIERDPSNAVLLVTEPNGYRLVP
jgi:DNA-binding response OmpR family regulator